MAQQVAGAATQASNMAKARLASTTVESLDTDASVQPLFLVLGRKGLVDVEFRNPHSNDTVYRVRDTGRGHLSSKPDYELYRSQASDLFVGSIRFGKTTTETSLPLTGKKSKTIDKITLQQGSNSTEFTWKTIKSQRKTVRDRWTETNDNGQSELYTNDEVIILELVDEADLEARPICVVRLYNTQPTGRVEIWTKQAWVDHGGDWHVLDELVVSAYANMEKAKRSLMKGIDPSSWRGAAF